MEGVESYDITINILAMPHVDHSLCAIWVFARRGNILHATKAIVEDFAIEIHNPT